MNGEPSTAWREGLLHGDIVKITLVDKCVDTEAPIGELRIQSFLDYTRSTAVKLFPYAEDIGTGVASMRFMNDGGTWSAWEPYATSKIWTLRNIQGTRTVYAQYKDKAGNVSTTTQHSIKLDTTKPTISGMASKPGSTTRDTTPLIKATVKDNNPLRKSPITVISNRQRTTVTNVTLYVAGKRITTLNYNAANGLLTYTSPKLSKGKKTAKIVARDDAGNVSTKSWSFTIK